MTKNPTTSSAPPSPPKKPDSIGKPSGKISVELSTRFLEHFSEQLYSSPQKAFEELISNGWDAGADYVDVRIATDLSKPGASLTVLDNGSSMNEEGLRQLWHIAASPKKNTPTLYGRPIIGKFGIGKLATYVLANKLTYICKATDGVIRRVTMDYADLKLENEDAHKFVRDLELDIYTVTQSDVNEALTSISDGEQIRTLIVADVPRPGDPTFEDEFGWPQSEFKPPPKGTWTLVILSELKDTGRQLKTGVLRRMLAAALPIGSEISIAINGEALVSSKLETPIAREWAIGPRLGIDTIEIDESDSNPDEEEPPAVQHPEDGHASTKISITQLTEPYPHITIPGIGSVSGRVRLYDGKIAKGKSEARGTSNGFHINVLGRVVNQNDPSFGEDNLNHAAWSRFRMTVRADGLNDFLTTNREQFKERRELKIFRAFLRKVFNLARNYYDSDESAAMPDGGDVLVQSLGVLSLSPLRNVVAEALAGQATIPGLFDDTGVDDKEAKRKSWQDDTSENIKNALSAVRYERLDDDSLVTFRLADNSIIVNKEHPFVEEHSRTKAEKELLRTVAMVYLLTDVYALDIGVGSQKMVHIRQYRDRLLRFRAMQRRQSGTYIARLLLQMQHDSKHYKRLEVVVSDALRYLGFEVEDKAQSGEPEGVARAYPTPTSTDPSEEKAAPPLYSFTFDAKASTAESAQTNNINLAGIVEHRERYKAHYALVVAPGYQDGALEIRCEQQVVTPITARDLGRLLELTVAHGAIPVTKLRELFSLFSPDAVTKWVDETQQWLATKRPLTLDIFLKALEHLKGKVPDVLSSSTVALICREELKAKTVKDADVVALVRGLAILIPDLIAIDGDKIIVNASSAKVAEAVRAQLEKLHSEEPLSPEKGTQNT